MSWAIKRAHRFKSEAFIFLFQLDVGMGSPM